jgi:hypothetical protein
LLSKLSRCKIINSKSVKTRHNSNRTLVCLIFKISNKCKLYLANFKTNSKSKLTCKVRNRISKHILCSNFLPKLLRIYKSQSTPQTNKLQISPSCKTNSTRYLKVLLLNKTIVKRSSPLSMGNNPNNAKHKNLTILTAT